MANTPNINLVKPLGTDRALVSVINDNSDKIDAFAGSANTNMANTQNGYAIVVDGNNAPKAITAGQYLFIKNHSTLSAGGYHATANIANGAAITSSNVAADADGVVNGAFSALNSKLTPSSVTVTPNSTYISSTQISCAKNNYIANLSGWFNANANIPSNGATILSNLPIRYSNNIKVLLVNQTTGGVYHCLIDNNGDLKTDYNRENIPSGEYRIICCTYLLN